MENAARDVLRLGWQKARQMELQNDFQVQHTVTQPVKGHSKHLNPESYHDRSPPTRLTLDLKEIIDQLPDAQRKIITADSIARDDVASSGWLAEELSMSPSTIRVYRKRAMDRIRKALRERGHDSL